MHISTILALALTPLFPLVLSTHLLISIPASQFLPQPSNLPPSTTATLTTLHHIHTSPLRSDNTFDFRNVTSGSYLLDIHCRTHAFAPLRVDVSEGGKDSQGEEVEVWTTFRGNEWGNKGETLGVREVEGRVGIWGFEARAIGVKEYLIERPGCAFPFYSSLPPHRLLLCGENECGYLLTRIASFAIEPSQESDDSHCWSEHGGCIWHAVSYG